VPDKHLNLNVRGLGTSATVAINDRSNALRAEGRQVAKLGLGQSPFPVPDPVVDALRTHAREKDYLPVRGLPALCRSVADYTGRASGVDARPEDVLIGPGSKELMFLLQLTFYGDLVIPTPAWVSYAPQAKIIGRQVRLVPTGRDDGWMLTPQGLDDICREDVGRPRIVILNYPSNPVGRTYEAAELEEIARVARKHGVVLLSDEIYAELHHEGRHLSIARYYPEGTIVSSGLSKWCGAGGWRLGTFVFPRSLDWLLDGMAAAASETFTSTSAPIQHAAVTAFEGGEEIERYLGTSRRVLRAIGDASQRALTAAGIVCLEPQGGFYLWPELDGMRERLAARGIADSPTMVERLLEETGVAILPGSAFGRPAEELSARLAYVDFDGGAALAAAAERPAGEPLGDDFVATYAAPVHQAIRAMVDWVNAA